MRSLKEYKPTPMTDRHTRPSPSTEANDFRIKAFELFLLLAALSLVVCSFI